MLTQSGGAWVWHRADDDSTYNFDSSGKLQAVVPRNGWATTYAYNDSGQLASVTNAFGRILLFAYIGGKLATVTTPDGRVVAYSYDSSGRLSMVAYPDSSTRTFTYENASYTQALTGIIDETGTRWGTFGYDSQGRATSTQLVGGVDSYQVSYPSPEMATVLDPLGTSRNYSYATTAGRLAVISGSLPSGKEEADAASRVQDDNGLITSETDFKGIKTDTTWDVARRLPLSVTRAVGTPEAQTVTTQWHATFSLPLLVTESGRTTAYTYDDKGNVLSRAITDTASSPNTTRTWSWTWNPQGLAATETAPNGAVTTYTYDPRGNLTKAVNALGHESLYSYDSANRVISTTAPNGLVTTFTWDARDRLLTRTVGGQHTTTLTYKPTGLVDTLTLPTGLVLSYTYDAAHRLTGWSNNRGESGSYTLDAMGNRTAEQIKDSAGTVAWSTARTINNLNRLAAKTDGPNETSSFGYDANGELVTETNGLNQSTQYGLDPLRRVKTITNAANATAGLAWNALDAVTSASDFKGAVTSYGRDAQGNATAETSADAGPRSTQYDALGLPSQIVDALGQATHIQRDALGRPTQLSFADGKSTYLRYDLPGSSYNAADAPNASKGYLSEMQDRSGTTRYKRDAFGHVVQKTQVFPNGVSGSLAYGYNAQGLRESMTNPGGYPTQYLYDGTGRLVQINFRGVPQLTNITWNPMGQPTGWTWAFATSFLGQSAADERRDHRRHRRFADHALCAQRAGPARLQDRAAVPAGRRRRERPGLHGVVDRLLHEPVEPGGGAGGEPRLLLCLRRGRHAAGRERHGRGEQQRRGVLPLDAHVHRADAGHDDLGDVALCDHGRSPEHAEEPYGVAWGAGVAVDLLGLRRCAANGGGPEVRERGACAGGLRVQPEVSGADGGQGEWVVLQLLPLVLADHGQVQSAGPHRP